MLVLDLISEYRLNKKLYKFIYKYTNLYKYTVAPRIFLRKRFDEKCDQCEGERKKEREYYYAHVYLVSRVIVHLTNQIFRVTSGLGRTLLKKDIIGNPRNG